MLNLKINTIMKTFISTFIALLVFAAHTVVGQSYVFKVLANKGANKMKSESEMVWKPVKAGLTLNNGDELQVSENGYLGLVHVSGKTIELKNATSVDIEELASKIKTNTTVASKYANFVFNKMAAEETNKEKLVATGAVNRAVVEGAIKVFMPFSTNVLDKTTVKWENKNAPYMVTLRNEFDVVIYSEVTSNNSLELDFTDPKLTGQRLVVFNVELKNDSSVKSTDFGIKRISAEDASIIKENLSQLKNVMKEESALNHIILASFYESNNLMADALNSYEAAVELSPEVDDIQAVYENFLNRNQF